MMQLYFPFIFYNASSKIVTALPECLHWNCRISFRYNLAAWLCEYEKHQQKYFSLPSCDMKCTQVARTQIATKYALLLFAQTLVILIANPFYERKFILRSRTTTGVSNCAIDIQQDLINLHISVLRMTIRILYSKLILSINYVCSMIYSLLFRNLK